MFDMDKFTDWYAKHGELVGVIHELATDMQNKTGIRPETIQISPLVASELENPIELMGMKVIVNPEVPEGTIYFLPRVPIDV